MLLLKVCIRWMVIQLLLIEIASICRQNHIHLIVDEAHAIGVFGKQGRGLCEELNIENDCFARIYTYGKAMGCHGASVVGSLELKKYLINFSRSFIYTTAMPEHSLIAIKASYQLLLNTTEIDKLRSNINYFNTLLGAESSFLESQSAIHCKLISGNTNVQLAEDKLTDADIFVKSIKSPTVKIGSERLRICLHSFNSKEQIEQLCSIIK